VLLARLIHGDRGGGGAPEGDRDDGEDDDEDAKGGSHVDDPRKRWQWHTGNAKSLSHGGLDH